LGYDWCDTLFYVTGGLAYGSTRYTVPVLGEETKSRAGWTVGAGIERMFWCNWSVKLEYLYYQLGKHNHERFEGAEWRTGAHTLKLGVNYHF
jgi:outer membrane immunogenic protein